MDISIVEVVVVGRTVEAYTFPLTTYTVVGQIVEHVVDAVATENNVLLGCALSNESSVDVNACLVGKIESGACRNGERSGRVYTDASAYDDGLGAGNGGVALDMQTVQKGGIT